MPASPLSSELRALVARCVSGTNQGTDAYDNSTRGVLDKSSPATIPPHSAYLPSYVIDIMDHIASLIPNYSPPFQTYIFLEQSTARKVTAHADAVYRSSRLTTRCADHSSAKRRDSETAHYSLECNSTGMAACCLQLFVWGGASKSSFSVCEVSFNSG